LIQAIKTANDNIGVLFKTEVRKSESNFGDQNIPFLGS
jgi:hypothetical protein